MDPQQLGTADRTIVLPMDLTIECVTALRLLLLEATASPVPLQLDAAAVDQCDTAGLQLLLAARRHAHAHGGMLAVIHAPPQLTAAAGHLGLVDALGLTASECLDA